MGALLPPSRTGARVAGDMFQWWHAWEACVDALTERETGEANPIMAVEVEAAGVGNLDDVVRRRLHPPHSYSQIKYAVDAKTPVGETFLLRPSDQGGPCILEKIASAWRELTADGSPVKLSLITNRSLDHDDPLMAGLDQRKGLLMPRAGEQGARSRRGQARRRWAAGSGLTEAELLALLEVLEFDAGWSVRRLRGGIAAKMRALGLPAVDKDLEAGGNWVARRVRDSQIELDLSAIDAAVAELWPQARLATSPATSIIAGFSAPEDVESPRAETVRERIGQLPAAMSERLEAAWRDYPHDTWQLVTALTQAAPAPAEVVAEWAGLRPAWLEATAWQVRLAAGELAGAYGQSHLAAELFCAAAASGAPRADFWRARAALLYEDEGDQDARARTLGELGPGPSTEPYARAVTAIAAGDWETAARELEQWTCEPSERALRALTLVRVAAADGKHFTTAMLDRALQATRVIPAPPVWSPALAIVRARLLVARSRIAVPGSWDQDLREAADLLLRARDERRAVRADSGEAVAVLCEVRLMQQDAATVIQLASPGESGATRSEADHPGVREHLAVAAVLEGDLALARACELDLTDGAARARVGALLADAEGGDPVPYWQRAIELARSDDQLALALYGLAQTGTADLPRLEEFAARHPGRVLELRAQVEFAAGRPESAVRLLRAHRQESLSAALTLAYAYGAAGRINDQVQTLTDAADHFGDASLSLTAVEVLARNDRAHDAAQRLDELLARTPATWPLRGPALLLAAHLAQQERRLDRACALLRSLLDLDPSATAARWVLIDILLHRGQVDSAWHELSQAPEPLEPTATDQAHVWIQLQVRCGSPADTVAGCLRLLRRFADDEDFSAFVVINLIAPGTIDQSVPTHLRDEVRVELDRFFHRWPAAAVRRISTDDPDEALTQVSGLGQADHEALQQRRFLLHGVLTGSVPLSFLAAAAARGYAEVLILRGGSVIAARHADPDEHRTCAGTAADHTETDIIIDTTAAAVLNLLPPALQDTALSRFARVITTDTVTLDALAARDLFAMRSPGTLIYDEQRGAPAIVPIAPQEIDRCATEAADLLVLTQRLERMPRPEPSIFAFADARPIITWASAADLARALGTALWSDDPILRLLARDAGIPATSTPAILDQLLAQDDITDHDHETAIRILITARVGDFPLHGQRLLELAEHGQWLPLGVAHALSRPAAWGTPKRAAELFSRLVDQVRLHQPHTLPNWLFMAVYGATSHAATPLAATIITADLMAIAMRPDKTDSAAAVGLTIEARKALAQTAHPDQPARPDPLPRCAQIIRDTYARHLHPGSATRLVLSLVSDHSKDDRVAVVEALLSN